MGLSDIWGDVSEAVEVSPGVPGQGLFSVPYSASSSLPPMPLIVNERKWKPCNSIKNMESTL